MASKYNSADFRQMAVVKKTWHDDITAEMLFEAAGLLDKLERKEKRKKDYEYTVIAKKHDGEVFIDTEHFSTIESTKKNAEEGFYDVIRYVRREIGKWEEVK